MPEGAEQEQPRPRVVKTAGYQRASVTLGASGFQERKEVWGHPAPLPPFSSKQPAPADNRAAPVPRRNSGPPAARAAPKTRDFPPFPLLQRAAAVPGRRRPRVARGGTAQLRGEAPAPALPPLTGGNWDHWAGCAPAVHPGSRPVAAAVPRERAGSGPRSAPIPRIIA